jgi:hypothetical protein
MLTTNSKGWERAYAILIAYALAILATFMVAGAAYEPISPLATSFGVICRFADKAELTLDVASLLFPIATLAFCRVAPFRMKPGAGAEAIPVLCLGFIAMGLFLTPLMAWPMLVPADLDIEGRSKVARAVGAAAVSQPAFLLVCFFYFNILVMACWLAYFAIPKAFMTISKEN